MPINRLALVCLTVCCLAFGGAAYAQQAAAPKPAVDPMAAARKQQHDDLMTLYAPYQQNTGKSLTEANRSERELQVWLSEKVADLLSIDPKTASMKLNEGRPFFTPDAYNNYLLTLGGLPYAEQLRNGQIKLSTIVDNMPALLSSGTVAGRYIWVFELTTIIAAKPVHSGIDLQGPETLRTSFRIQLARSYNAPPPHNVLIDIWQLKSQDDKTSPDTAPPTEKPTVVVN